MNSGGDYKAFEWQQGDGWIIPWLLGDEIVSEILLSGSFSYLQCFVENRGIHMTVQRDMLLIPEVRANIDWLKWDPKLTLCMAA